MQSVISDLGPRIQETGGSVEVDVELMVEADRSQIERLLLNLVSNGLKFHRPGVPPRVSVSAALIDGALAPASSGQPGAVCELRVSDEGIGVDPKFNERIFGVFERLHGDSEYPGTGIGLALCRKIVERHRGSIRIESEVAAGSTFIVRLPLCQPQG